MTNQRANAGRKDWRRICGPVVCSPSGSKVTRIRRVFISGGEYKVRPYEPNGGFARLGKKGHDPDRTAWLDRGRVLYVARVTGLEPATSSVTGWRSKPTELHPRVDFRAEEGRDSKRPPWEKGRGQLHFPEIPAHALRDLHT